MKGKIRGFLRQCSRPHTFLADIVKPRQHMEYVLDHFFPRLEATIPDLISELQQFREICKLVLNLKATHSRYCFSITLVSCRGKRKNDNPLRKHHDNCYVLFQRHGNHIAVFLPKHENDVRWFSESFLVRIFGLQRLVWHQQPLGDDLEEVQSVRHLCSFQRHSLSLMRLTQVSLSYSAETSPILARQSPDGVLNCSRSNLRHWP